MGNLKILGLVDVDGKSMKKIVLADDHTIFRACLVGLLDAEPDLEVIQELDDGNLILQSVMEQCPDLVLMDLSMPKTNGLKAIEKIKFNTPEIKVLVLTIHKQDEYICAAFKAGADGYAVKDDDIKELLSAIRKVLNGEMYISPNLSSKISTINAHASKLN